MTVVGGRGGCGLAGVGVKSNDGMGACEGTVTTDGLGSRGGGNDGGGGSGSVKAGDDGGAVDGFA